jgi:hypothetical protein
MREQLSSVAGESPAGRIELEKSSQSATMPATIGVSLMGKQLDKGEQSRFA